MSAVYLIYDLQEEDSIYFQVKVNINSQTLNGNSWFSENPVCKIQIWCTLRFTCYLQGEEEPFNYFLFAETGWL